jgi:hypothetical protein
LELKNSVNEILKNTVKTLNNRQLKQKKNLNNSLAKLEDRSPEITHLDQKEKD